MSARTAFTAPAHVAGARVPPGSNGGPPDQAPSLFWGGNGVQDPRVPYNTMNSASGAGICGWYGQGLIKVIGQVPSAISTTNIAAAQTLASGTPMTLVGTTGAGITVLATSMLAIGSMNTIPARALAIDGAPTYTAFGSLPNSFRTVFYDASGMIARAVSVTAAASATGGTITIRGADIYGYPLTQTVTAVAASTVNTLKAFKFVYSVTPGFTDGSHNYSIGTADVFGFPLIVKQTPDAWVYWHGVAQTIAGSTFTTAVLTSPSTAALGDVRGTWAPTSDASDGTKRLDIYVNVTLGDVATVPQSTGLFGQPQV